jgi:hypothetical protein
MTTVDGTREPVCLPDSGRCDGGPGPGPDPGPDPDPDPRPSCIDDAFEENDSIEEVQSDLSPGDYDNLRLCSDGVLSDDDYYALIVGDATQLSVLLFFSHADGDIDLSLRGEDGLGIIGSASISDDEEISICLSEGIYYINVWSVDADINAGYDMSIDFGRCCLDDPREANSDDNAQGATVIQLAAEYDDGQICEMDEDWFAINLVQGDVLTVTLLFDHVTPEQDLDVTVLSPDQRVVASGLSVTPNEEVEYPAVDAGVHYVRVFGHMNAANAYAIDFDVVPFEP